MDIPTAIKLDKASNCLNTAAAAAAAAADDDIL